MQEPCKKKEGRNKGERVEAEESNKEMERKGKKEQKKEQKKRSLVMGRQRERRRERKYQGDSEETARRQRGASTDGYTTPCPL